MAIVQSRRILTVLLAVAGLTFVAASPAVAGQARPVPQRVAADPQPSEVRAHRVNADGTITEDIWDAAPGVSAKQLYQTLAAEKVQGLIDPDAAAVQVVPGDCGIQGAYALERRCGSDRLHWGNGPHPVVMFIDYTSAAWPVYDSVVKWNQSTALDSGYRWYTKGCNSVNCAYVHNGSYGANGWNGHTSVNHSGLDPRVILSAYIQLNDSYGLSTTEHRMVTCHELGHALGLDHNDYTSSCLFWYAQAGTTVPNTGDFLMLDSIY